MYALPKLLVSQFLCSFYRHTFYKMPPKMKITREEELLLEGFNKNVSTKSSALFYGNAFIVSAIPVWLYWRVHSVDMSAYAIMFVIGKFNFILYYKVVSFFLSVAKDLIKFLVLLLLFFRETNMS